VIGPRVQNHFQVADHSRVGRLSNDGATAPKFDARNGVLSALMIDILTL
jgi:hypothetical protein